MGEQRKTVKRMKSFTVGRKEWVGQVWPITFFTGRLANLNGWLRDIGFDI